jgi:hypothetical protein
VLEENTARADEFGHPRFCPCSPGKAARCGRIAEVGASQIVLAMDCPFRWIKTAVDRIRS